MQRIEERTRYIGSVAGSGQVNEAGGVDDVAGVLLPWRW